MKLITATYLATVLVGVSLPIKTAVYANELELVQAFAVKQLAELKHKEKELYCLAKNIYHEARGEPHLGKLAVAQVTLNRVNSKRWGSTVCEVVYEKSKTGAPQFSWTTMNLKVTDYKQWKISKQIAEKVLESKVAIKNFSYYFFHNESIYYAQAKPNTRKIGSHIFYN